MRLWLFFAMLLVTVRPMAAQGLLPARFAGWQTVPGSAATATLDTLTPENAALFRACHEQSAERRSYQKNGATINVTLYWMGDPSYGYSVYSLLRPQPATDFRPSPHSAIGTGSAMILVGNLLAEGNGPNLPAYAHDFSALVAALQQHASSEPYPSLWQYLPTAHFVGHSDRYALDTQTLSRALTEAAQTRLTFIAGSRDNVFREDYERARNPELLDWRRRQWQAEPPTRNFGDAPDRPAPTLREDVFGVLDRLRAAGIGRVIAVDLTRPEIGIPVVRVVIPGLEGVGEASQIAVGLEGETGEAKAEGRGLGVDAVGAADAERVAMLQGPLDQGVAIGAGPRQHHLAGLAQLPRQCRVEHVGGGQAAGDPNGRRSVNTAPFPGSVSSSI